MSTQFYSRHFGGSAPENYERYFVPVIGKPLALNLVSAAALRPGERVLDVACGTGVVARLAAEHVGPRGAVAGLDVNPGMLKVAESLIPAGHSTEWHEASAETMPLPEGGFDVAFCQLGLQFMSDKPAALREIRRVLAPGGRFLFNVPGPEGTVFAVMAEALERHIDPQAAQFVRAVFSLHDPDEIRGLLDDAGFHDIDIRSGIGTLSLPTPEEFLWQYVHSTPLAALLENVDDASRAALERQFVSKLEDLVEDGALMYEQNIVVATARKGNF